MSHPIVWDNVPKCPVLSPLSHHVLTEVRFLCALHLHEKRSDESRSETQ
jgi:hypothetical protein